MNREEFVGYVESRAKELGIALHQDGELSGLPREFHQAVAVASFLNAMQQPAPTWTQLRTWYGQAAMASPETARWVYLVVGCLRNPDLQALQMSDLLTFWPRLDEWARAAYVVASAQPRK